MDLEKFAIYVNEEINSVELKKKSGCGEFNGIVTFDSDFKNYLLIKK